MPYLATPPDSGREFTKVTHSETYPAIDPTKADLSGKVVLITGASKGVGRQIALSFAKAGASLAIAARTPLSSLSTELLTAAQNAGKPRPEILELNLDVLDQKSVEKAASLVEKEFGRLDILINNAGYLSEFKPLVETETEEWWRNWEVNVKGVYLVTRALLPLMLKGGQKEVINLSSVGALLVTPGASGYQGTKFALLRLTEHLLVDYADQGLLAYCVHPGGVKTELALNMPESLHSGLTTEPGLAGDVLVSLTSEKREWLAGRYISVNWDVPELYSREEEIVKEDKLRMRMKF